MDASIATAVSYLNVAFRRRNCIRQARFRMRLQRMQALYKRFIALYQRLGFVSSLPPSTLSIIFQRSSFSPAAPDLPWPTLYSLYHFLSVLILFFSCIALRSPFSGSWFTIISLNFNESSSQIWLLWTIDENLVWIWSSAQSSNSVSVSSRVQVCPLAVIANVKINRKIRKTWTLHYRCEISRRVKDAA